MPKAYPNRSLGYLRQAKNRLGRVGFLIPVFLAGFIPIFDFYRHNIVLLKFGDQILPIILITFLVAVALLVVIKSAILKNYHKSAIFVVAALYLFFSYSSIKDVLASELRFLSFLAHDVLLLPFMATLLATLLIYLNRTSRQLKPAILIFSIFFLIVVTPDLVTVTRHKLANTGFPEIPVHREELQYAGDHAPDIYYLVFDRYASNHTLRDVFGYDNSSFLTSLSDEGIYVADDSASNYLYTSQSLASSLNLDYIPSAEKAGITTETPLFSAIENNSVINMLQAGGYEYVHVGSPWNPTTRNRNADRLLLPRSGFYFLGRQINMAEHTSQLMERTAWIPVLNGLPNNKLLGIYPPQEGGLNLHQRTYREAVFNQFEHLDGLAAEKSGQPRFTFAHFISPHDPYVIGADGSIPHGATSSEGYLGQIDYLNRRILELVAIIKSQDRPSIIVITSDEGPYPEGLDGNKLTYDWGEADDDTLREKVLILNAYYFPDGEYPDLYPGITPVNTFRLIFNKYFGTDFEILLDKVHSHNGPYRFEDVTQRIKP